MLLLLAGCPIQITKTCEEDEGVVGDDTVLDLGFTVTELAAQLSLADVVLTDLDAADRAATMDVTPGDGDNVLVNKTVHKENEGGIGPNREIAVEFTDGCTDELTAPVDVHLAADDVLVDAVGEIYTADDGTLGTGTLLTASFDPLAATLPILVEEPVEGLLRARFFDEVDPMIAVWVTGGDGVRYAVLSTEATW